MRAEQQEGEEVRWNARGLGPPPSRYNVLRMLRERRAPNQLLVEERGGKKRRKKRERKETIFVTTYRVDQLVE